ncbi:LAMI_0D12310g1_1 [Lachancea mirantina]|uniref:LAMI_0D12310g1_1 n=1 Tax=Lachancea mirantina TaxID=1230905 RepID=A0A1G4JG66_9SACH|nr:LAMI_0D12310g1_1 [Lachancea mirantina]
MSRKMSTKLKYYDIGVNLSDPMYKGIYNGKKYHEGDLQRVLNRAGKAGVRTMLLTGSSFQESQEVAKLASIWNQKPSKVYYTLGVHPCCVNEFVLAGHNSGIDNPSNDEEFNNRLEVTDFAYTRRKLQDMYALIASKAHEDPNFRAIGEIGLDYDRFYYSSRKLQLLFFEEQLKMSCFFPKVPLFLHMRNCCKDFVAILSKFILGFVDEKDQFEWRNTIQEQQSSAEDGPQTHGESGVRYKFSPARKFVVHSFTGSVEEMSQILNLGPNCYIGMNGCSFKTQENLDCVKQVPLKRLLLETDAPWCDIRRTHESYKYLFENAECRNPEKEDPWEHGLQRAYPELPQWFASVKRDKLVKKTEESWDEIMVKSRNEPCTMGHVTTVVANCKQLPLEQVAEIVWQTSCDVYGA